MAVQVSPADRFRIHSFIADRRKLSGGKRDVVAYVLDIATYIESFPRSYDAASVEAARRLHTWPIGCQEWDEAFCNLATLRGIDFPALHRGE